MNAGETWESGLPRCGRLLFTVPNPGFHPGLFMENPIRGSFRKLLPAIATAGGVQQVQATLPAGTAGRRAVRLRLTVPTGG